MKLRGEGTCEVIDVELRGGVELRGFRCGTEGCVVQRGF